jgi:bacteriorhodopsin
MVTLLFVLLIIAAIGLIPAWPYHRRWGYYPSGLVGFLILLIVMALSGRL